MGLGSNVRKRSERGARSKVDLEMVDKETKTKWKGVYFCPHHKLLISYLKR